MSKIETPPSRPALPEPAQLAEAWTRVITNGFAFARAQVDRSFETPAPLPYDPAAPFWAFSDLATKLLTDPHLLIEAQQRAMLDGIKLGFGMMLRMAGADSEPLAAPARGDRRFSDPAWTSEPVFDCLKQAYLLTVERLLDLVAKTQGLRPEVRTQVEFFLQQALHALSPSNFVLTNPEAIRRAMDTGFVSLFEGFANLLADAAAPDGLVRRRAPDDFEIGVTIAATPGSVVYQNALMQLIQYRPTTETVYRRPLLYVPPLVNKYYFLDLQPRSSLIGWLVGQGYTVFVVSWVNPGPELRDKDMADYVAQGPLAALDAIEAATGEREVDAFAFCMGGTLLAMTLARLAATGESARIHSATTIGSLFDFRNLGQWSTFTDSRQIEALGRHLDSQGAISSGKLQALFSIVRSNDLIWSSVVNHYLLNREAPPSDILYWFADGAHIPAAFLKTYVQELLVENRLIQPGAMMIDGVPLDLGAVKTPLFAVSLKDDHVSAWEATYDGLKQFGGPVRFLLGGSGHNAGVINPPSANKHGYWSSAQMPPSAEEWFAAAEKREGSWWPEWDGWLSEDGKAERVAARVPGEGKLEVIEPAPGSYVRMR